MENFVRVNVHLPPDINRRGETVPTAVWEQPVQSRRVLRLLNRDGARQENFFGYTENHRAVNDLEMDV